MRNVTANWLKLNNPCAQLIKYLMVGSFTALADFGLFTLLVHVGKLSISLANIFAVTTATLLNFMFNRKWAFESSWKFDRSLILYLLLFLFNMFFSTYIIQTMAAAGVPDLGAKLISMGLITAWNFLLYRKFIFP